MVESLHNLFLKDCIGVDWASSNLSSTHNFDKLQIQSSRFFLKEKVINSALFAASSSS